MVVPPAVIVHGQADARLALAPRLPVTLLSAPGAALFAGCGWWSALVTSARADFPATEVTDVLDCADGSGQAMAALRIGLVRLVLWPVAPGWAAVAAIAMQKGGWVVPTLPSALDLAEPGAERRLLHWLQSRRPMGDNGVIVG